MRQTVEIICAVKDEEPVTDDELKLALVALSGWAGHAWRLLCDLAEDAKLPPAVGVRAQCEKDSYWRMLKTSPDAYLGPRYTPGTEENREAVARAKAIFKAATGKDL